MSTQTSDAIISSLGDADDVIQTTLREAEQDVDLCACGKNLNDARTVTLYKNIELNEATLADKIVGEVMNTVPSSTVTPTPRREHVSETSVYNADDVITALEQTMTNFSLDSYENFFTYDEKYELCLSCAIDAGADIQKNDSRNIQINNLNSRQNTATSNDGLTTDMEQDVIANIYTRVVFYGIVLFMLLSTVIGDSLPIFLAFSVGSIGVMSMMMRLWHKISFGGDTNE